MGPDQQGPHQLLPRPLTQGLDPAPAPPSQCALSQTLVVTVCLPTLPGHCAVQLRVRASLCPPPYPSSHAQALWLPGAQGLMQAHDTQIPSFTPSAVQLPRAAGKPDALGSRRATACPAPGGPTPSTLSFYHPVIPTHHPPFSLQTPRQRCPGIYVQLTALPRSFLGSTLTQPALHHLPLSPQLRECPANAPLLLQPHFQGPQSWSRPLVTAGRLPPLPSLAGMCHHHYSPACCQLPSGWIALRPPARDTLCSPQA